MRCKADISWLAAEYTIYEYTPGEKVLLIDLDPQCKLSFAMLGADTFINALPTKTSPTERLFMRFFSDFFKTPAEKQILPHQNRTP